ncbi:MAG TPA: thiolase family protein [Acidimicrobiales bacterium]|nr:thiolase family protein [Acidimicrobiales bacterium]
MNDHDPVVVGAATTRFGMFVDVSMRTLAAEAADRALADAGLHADDVDLVVVGNAAAGLLTGQEMIRAQTALSTSSLTGLPMLSIENACASSSSAFHLGWLAVASGVHETVVVVGVEKMTHEDRGRSGRALATAIDVEVAAQRRAKRAAKAASQTEAAVRIEEGPVFMRIYAAEARAYLEAAGATAADLAAVAAKSLFNGSLNPIAQHRTRMTVEEVLGARTIVAPLTRPMCSSIGDGAAALVITSAARARRGDRQAVRILASVIGSGRADADTDLVARTGRRAYELASVGPPDVSLVELHDAAAPAEFVISEELGLAAPGDAPRLLRDGTTSLGGTQPVNASGGLLARGHPIGATGAAQIAELIDQLRGRAGERQVTKARIGLAQNSGGSLGKDPAACVVTILASM